MAQHRRRWPPRSRSATECRALVRSGWRAWRGSIAALLHLLHRRGGAPGHRPRARRRLDLEAVCRPASPPGPVDPPRQVEVIERRPLDVAQAQTQRRAAKQHDGAFDSATAKRRATSLGESTAVTSPPACRRRGGGSGRARFGQMLLVRPSTPGRSLSWGDATAVDVAQCTHGGGFLLWAQRSEVSNRFAPSIFTAAVQAVANGLQGFLRGGVARRVVAGSARGDACGLSAATPAAALRALNVRTPSPLQHGSKAQPA